MVQPPVTANGPLHGIRVLEFSQIVAAPTCGYLLADLGADVVKVEPPGGEQTRRTAAVVPNEGKGYQALNRGKRSLIVEMHDPRGQALIQKIMPTIDVLLINYRLGVAERMGIDYATVRKLRPDIIYWQNTGFGESGPDAYRAGSDIVAQAYSGLMALDSKMNDDGAPDLIASPIADIATGLGAAMAICSALYHRAITGEGQRLASSLLRSSLMLMNGTVMREPVHDAVVRDPMVQAVDKLKAQGAPYDQLLAKRGELQLLRTSFRLYYGGYKAQGGAVVLGALTKQNRDGMRKVLGIYGEEHSDDPDYDAYDPANQKQAEEWKRVIRAKFMERTAEQWVAAFDAAGVPVAPVAFPEDMADNPQALADEMIFELVHTITGPQRVVGPIVTMSKTPTGPRRAAPALGEHSREILIERGVPADEVEALIAADVVYQG
ncbi:MAG: CoA transferase [Dehalococcoidia bacterium]|nr:CoA transferase [Dehalococcoidia bacterium]